MFRTVDIIVLQSTLLSHFEDFLQSQEIKLKYCNSSQCVLEDIYNGKSPAGFILPERLEIRFGADLPKIHFFQVSQYFFSPVQQFISANDHTQDVRQNFTTALIVVLASHSSNFHHWPLFALLVALVLPQGDSADLNFAILCMIIDFNQLIFSSKDTTNKIVSDTVLSAVAQNMMKFAEEILSSCGLPEGDFNRLLVFTNNFTDQCLLRRSADFHNLCCSWIYETRFYTYNTAKSSNFSALELRRNLLMNLDC